MISALVIFFAVGCSNKSATYTDPEKPIHIRVNEEFIIGIQLDPPGYYWKEHHDKDMLYLLEETYDPVEKGANSVGAVGTQYFRYRALKPGVTYVTITKLRVSEPDIAVEKVFQVNIDRAEFTKVVSIPRKLTNYEKQRVIAIAFSTPEVSKWVEGERECSVGLVQWYALWPHEWMVFDCDDITTNPNYELVPESAAWYPGVTITFRGKTITHLTEFRIAIYLETGEAVWMFGPIEANG